MASYRELFIEYMEENGIKYTEGNNYLKIVYNGDNLKSIPVVVFLNEEDDNIQAYCMEIASFKNKAEAGYKVCNEMNAKYRWVNFYIDKDMDVVCQIDAEIDEENCGKRCLNQVRRIVNITDDAYPDIMRALWGI